MVYSHLILIWDKCSSQCLPRKLQTQKLPSRCNLPGRKKKCHPVFLLWFNHFFWVFISSIAALFSEINSWGKLNFTAVQYVFVHLRSYSRIALFTSDQWQFFVDLNRNEHYHYFLLSMLEIAQFTEFFFNPSFMIFILLYLWASCHSLARNFIGAFP